MHTFPYLLVCKHISSSVAINDAAHVLKDEHIFHSKGKEKGEKKEKVIETWKIVTLQ